MKNIGTITAAAFLALVLALYMCTFQVRFNEVAIRKTWGQPAKDAITEPGLKFKWPAPIQTIVRYDKRTRMLEDKAEETRTTDGKNVVLETYTLWRIADPARFHINFPIGEDDGERKLRTTVGTHINAVVGQRTFNEFISTDAKERKLGEIESAIKDAVARDVRNEYGIEVVGFGFKKLALPQSVTSSIFESMKSRESAKASRYTAEGEAKAKDILAGAKAAEERIMAAAQSKVGEIETEAKRVESDYYKEFSKYPELRMYLDALRALAESLKERTTLILDTQQAPWSMFNEETRNGVRPAQPAADQSHALPPVHENHRDTVKLRAPVAGASSKRELKAPPKDPVEPPAKD